MKELRACGTNVTKSLTSVLTRNVGAQARKNVGNFFRNPFGALGGGNFRDSIKANTAAGEILFDSIQPLIEAFESATRVG